MAIEKDGGPAFPSGTGLTYGMSLRDWFAGQAPITLRDAMIACGFSEEDEITTLQKDESRAVVMAVLTQMRWEYADAMLAARKEG